MPVLPNGMRKTRIILKGWMLLPIIGKCAQSAERECLDQCFLEPLARIAWVAVGAPAVSKNMAKLVAELVGELRPVAFAYVHDDPGERAPVLVEPYRRAA